MSSRRNRPSGDGPKAPEAERAGSCSGPGRFARPRWQLVAALLAGLAWTCTWQGPAPEVDGENAQLTLLHTADWHSRLVPYEMTVGQVDQNLGLVQENEPFGGAARVAYLIERERARSGRVLHLDSGDLVQGAPIFNFFDGEASIRSLAAIGVDAIVIGNHEFDAGAENFARQLQRWGTFPALAANYMFEPVSDILPDRPKLAKIAKPYTVLNADGLKVGVIGLGNLSSLSSLFEHPNRLGIVPLETVSVAQFYIDFLRPQVDLIVMLTHSGVTADNRLVQDTSGIDVVLGGHLHVVLDPPQVTKDCAKETEDGRHYIQFDNAEDPDAPPVPPATEPGKIGRYCRQRDVIITHSGAFTKYLGRLDVVASNVPERVQPKTPENVERFPEVRYDPRLDGYEVLSHQYELFPVDSTVPEDPRVKEILEPYEQQLVNLVDLDLLVGYAPQAVRRFGARAGDSPLGNLIADSMLVRIGVETDFALTNTTGIRSDFSPGPVSTEQLFNVFPFDNTVATMFLSGREIQEMFDFIARRSAGRGCQSQAQISGARIVLDCSGNGCPEGEPCATQIAIGRTDRTCERDADCNDGELCDPLRGSGTGRCLLPLDRHSTYELATSNYLASGGSGFRVLERNTTTIDTELPMRQVLSDYIRNGAPCGADDSGELPGCRTDEDCDNGFVCACPQRVQFDEASRMCNSSAEACGGESGRCVLQECRQNVAEFRRARRCAEAIDPVARARCECDSLTAAGEQCKVLACIDDNLGAASDGRVKMRSF